MTVFKNLHVAFAQNSCTLYLHKYLYKDRMPRWVLQAFTLCSLYTNQVAANRAVVLRVLHENVADLKTGSPTSTTTPHEKLARVHALIFYQTVRMFDGDITLGQQADDDIPLLQSWTKDLCKVRDNLDDLSEKPNADIRESPPKSWEVGTFTKRSQISLHCLLPES